VDEAWGKRKSAYIKCRARFGTRTKHMPDRPGPKGGHLDTDHILPQRGAEKVTFLQDKIECLLKHQLKSSRGLGVDVTVSPLLERKLGGLIL